MPDKRCRRSLTLLAGVFILSGCGPEGVGSIKVDRKEPGVRNLKRFEDVKGPKSTKRAGKSARSTNGSLSDFQ
jgi:hypothetical protein